jgi:dTDP-4-amino-4,6-dideoxygalactose transaminase
MNRDTFMQKMVEKGIGTGLHYEPPHLYRYYRETFGFKVGDYPKAEDTGSRIVSLPLFADMTLTEQDRVISAMAEIFEQCGEHTQNRLYAKNSEHSGPGLQPGGGLAFAK